MHGQSVRSVLTFLYNMVSLCDCNNGYTKYLINVYHTQSIICFSFPNAFSSNVIYYHIQKSSQMEGKREGKIV